MVILTIASGSVSLLYRTSRIPRNLVDEIVISRITDHQSLQPGARNAVLLEFNLS